MPAILAKKLGMTQLFLEDGTVERVTVLEAGPCPVTGVRTHEVDGYEALQLAFGASKEKHLTRAELGHLKKAGASAHRHLVEFRDEAGELLLAAGAERELHGLVAVALVRADAGDGAGPGLEHGHALDAPVVEEALSHAELLGEDRGHRYDASRISMSTPAGRWSRRWSESTVFGVGWWMSISRLCVRISKCSRESLSLKGERITQ